jgi:Transglycosylase SLT domain
MANDNQGALTTSVLFLGSGAAGYALGRWIVARWLDNREAHTTPTSDTKPVAPPPLALPPASVTAPSAPLPSTPLPSTPLPSAPLASASLPKAPSAPSASPASPAPSQTPTAPPKVRPKPPVNRPIDPSGPVTTPSQVTRSPAASPAQAQGPVTSPSQLGGPPTAVTAPGELSRRFDPVFERSRGPIPIEYLRALVDRESATNPNARTSQARGLMQIIPVVLDDYNKRHGTSYQLDHLFDPMINVAIGCELLRRIIDSYWRNHPFVPNLQADWTNLRFVELLTFGWNAGFSESGGVGRVVGYLEQHGITDVTIDLVHRTADVAGASSHLSNVAKVSWCKSVAALYQRERSYSPITTS